MPAGDYLAGIGPAGFDPVTDPPARKVLRGPAAMAYDGASRDWPLNVQNNYRSVHPVDQQMALSVLVRKGTIASAPNVGSTLHEITHLSAKTLQSDVDNRVRTSEPAATLVRNGQAKILRNRIDVSGNALQVAVEYVNLATGQNITAY